MRLVYKCLFGSSSLVWSVVLHSVYNMGCKSAVTSIIHRACKMFGFSFDNFLNGDISVGNDRLLKFILTEQKLMAINFVKELIGLRDGIPGFPMHPLYHGVT